MKWLEDILKKYINESGVFDQESAMAEINKEAPKYTVPKEVYNTLSTDKKDADKRLKEYEDSKLTEDEKNQKIIEEAAAEKEKFQKASNRLEVEKILIGAGIQEDDYKDFIDGIISVDTEASKNTATAMANTFKVKIAAADAQAKNDLLKDTPRPEGGNDDGGETKSKQQIIAEELANEGATAMKASKSALDYYSGGN